MKPFFTLSIAMLSSVYAHSLKASEQDSGWNFYVGASAWQTEGSGNLKAPELNGYHLDLPETNTNMNSTLFVSMEHPNRFLPNIKISVNDVTQDAAGTFQLTQLPKPISAKGQIDLSHTDLLLFYRPINMSWLQLDVGVNTRHLYGSLDVDFIDLKFSSTSDLSATLPLFYGNVQLNMPWGFSAALSATAGDNGKESSQDICAQLNYLSPFGLGISAGYRKFNTALDSEAKSVLGKVDITADMDIKGPFAGLFYHF